VGERQSCPACESREDGGRLIADGGIGWTRALPLFRKTGRKRAALDLVDQGLLQQVDNDHFTSTRALRFNQFVRHYRGSSLSGPAGRPERLKAMTDRLASLTAL